MEGLGSVQQKISCVFETGVLDEASAKRENQPYKVVATNVIKERALENGVMTAIATEKLDGTCCYAAEFQGRPWLWARFDRKPNKGAEKRFRKFQQTKDKGGSDSHFKWDLAKDFKETPEYWMPASGVRVVDGIAQPDDIGHTPGWVPISPTARQYCWHLSAVDLKTGHALILRESDPGSTLYVDCVPLSSLTGQTLELIGTNINGNPYGLGSKKLPIHFLVAHGSIRFKTPPEINNGLIQEWFKEAGQVEGIVWHCENGQLFKVHRNHLSLAWPVPDPSLSHRPVTINIPKHICTEESDNILIKQLKCVNGQKCESFKEIEMLFSQAKEVNQDQEDEPIKS